MTIGIDVLRKALHASKHPGIRTAGSLAGLVVQGLPYLLSPAGRARPPLTIYWNVNSVCNLHCKMCDVGTFNEESNFYKNLRIDRKLHEIAPARFGAVVDEMARYRPTMAINGTEPLMYKPLGELIRYAGGRNIGVAVTTGGYNLRERAHELADARLSRLNVSIDGPRELHDSIRGRKDVFERATDGIRRFHEASLALGHRPEILVCATIMNLNYTRLVELYEAVRDLPLTQINFTNMNFVSEEMADAHNRKWGSKYAATVNCLSDEVRPDAVDTDLLHAQVEEVLRRGDPRVQFMPRFDRKALRRYYQRPTEFMGNIPCMATWYIAQIMADGSVIPYTRCYYVPLGNINEAGFLDIWNGEKARAWRRDVRRHKRFPACTRCDMVY